jgi:hypothetical protein
MRPPRDSTDPKLPSAETISAVGSFSHENVTDIRLYYGISEIWRRVTGCPVPIEIRAACHHPRQLDVPGSEHVPVPDPRDRDSGQHRRPLPQPRSPAAAAPDTWEQLRLRHRDTDETETEPADGLFVLIGAEPFTQWLPEGVGRDPRDFILTGPDLAERWTQQRAPFLLETSTPGVFAAGDVRHGSVNRVASAVGDGSIAIRLVHDYLA